MILNADSQLPDPTRPSAANAGETTAFFEVNPSVGPAAKVLSNGEGAFVMRQGTSQEETEVPTVMPALRAETHIHQVRLCFSK